MLREKIILSNLDLKILEFVKEEKFIFNIIKEFDMNYPSIKRHIDRLKKIKTINITSFGNFNKIKINRLGINLLEILNEK